MIANDRKPPEEVWVSESAMLADNARMREALDGLLALYRAEFFGQCDGCESDPCPCCRMADLAAWRKP